MNPRPRHLALIVLLLAGCAEKEATIQQAGPSGVAVEAELAQRRSGEFLAYSHSFTIDVREGEIRAAYAATVEACASDEAHGCRILDATISSGTQTSAYLRLRIEPEGVRPIVEVAAGRGTVVDERTHVEDLARPVVDNEKRLAMLETHRDRLLALYGRASDDIQALIKISEELSRVQSQLESAVGQGAHLRDRVEKDIVELRFSAIASRSFWRPIGRALSGFKGNLAEGISHAVLATAYLLPWLVLGIPALLLLRVLWRRGRRWKG